VRSTESWLKQQS